MDFENDSFYISPENRTLEEQDGGIEKENTPEFAEKH